MEKNWTDSFSQEQLEKRRKLASEWNRAHKDRVRQNARLYYAKNKDKISQALKAYGSTHKADNVRRVQAYRQRNPWYWNYAGSKQRCENPNNPRYKYYGAKGIKFLLSKSDVAFMWIRDKAPEMKHPSIDRINPNGNYCLENCRFLERQHNSFKAWVDRIGHFKQYIVPSSAQQKPASTSPID